MQIFYIVPFHILHNTQCKFLHILETDLQLIITDVSLTWGYKQQGFVQFIVRECSV